MDNKRKQDWNEFITMDRMLNGSVLDRRHSVAVGELNFHSYNQQYDQNLWFNGMNHRASISTASPSTPGLFSPSFLDTLKHDEFSSNDFLHEIIQPNIAPSFINTNDNLTNWLSNEPASKKRKTSPNLSTPSPSHPSIPEEEEEVFLHENQLITKRMIQGDENGSILKPLLEKYITSNYKNERKIMIYTSKVAQKSYGTEKRFLCPPPITVLSGASWFTPNTSDRSPQLKVHISGEKSSQNGVIEWKDENTSIGCASTGTCVSKQLHITDADEKRKSVNALVKVTLGNGSLLGTFPSKGIKVISKPSKKRQSLKNLDLCIHHGTTVSLFNRVRSQTVSTKYLGVAAGDNICFEARTTTWDPFIIWIVDLNRTPDQSQPATHPHYPPPPAIALHATSVTAVHYNQPVVLQCVKTGLVSPVMIIRRVDRGSMVVGGNRVFSQHTPAGGECGDEALGDPVSQLHKIAFQIVHDPIHQPQPTHEWTLPQMQQHATYLACLDQVVGMQHAKTERQMTMSRPVEDVKRKRRSVDTRASDKPYRRVNSLTEEFVQGNCGSCWTEDATDASVWTIVETQCATYKFWTPPAMVDLNAAFESDVMSPITPAPSVISQNLHYEHQNILYLHGENFTQDLSVWLGDVRCITEVNSRNTLSCQVPDLTQLLSSPTCTLDSTSHHHQVPILLVRGDGIVYNTDLYFTLC